MRSPQVLLVLFCALRSLTAADLAPASLGGVVLNDSGAPVRRAMVIVHPLLAPDDVWATAVTDAAGRFRADGLPPGRYSLLADRNGYLPKRPDEPVDLRPGEQRNDLVIRLSRPGVLSGVVVDAEGEPVPNALLSLLHKDYVRGRSALTPRDQQMADDRGQFRFFRLAPGAYALSGQSQPGMPNQQSVGLVPTYYPGVPAVDRAQVIPVQAGQEVSGITLRLIQLQLATVEGQISLPVQPPEGTQPGVSISPVTSNRFGGMQGAGVDEQRHFTFPGLAPGAYYLESSIRIGDRLYAARQRLDLSPGEQVSQLVLPLSPAIDLKGTLTVEGATPAEIAAHHVRLITGDENWQQQPAPAEVKPDGSFLIRNVPPGIWDINPEPVPKGGYIKAMTLGNLDVLRKDMIIGTTTSDPLKITVSLKGGHVHGSVDREGRGMVLLAPEGADKEVLSFYAVRRIDGRGQFDIDGITPGSYTLYAFQTLPDGLAWAAPEFLSPHRAQGKPIEIHEGDNAEVEKLPLIPKEANR